MSVPNQKVVLIKRDSDKARIDYFKVSNESLREAMYNLKPTTFMLWVYFADNKNGYRMDIYPIDICSITSISYSTYSRGMVELESKGYLLRSTVQKNLFLFVERSKSDKIKRIDKVNSVDEKDFDIKVKQLFPQKLGQNEEDNDYSDNDYE